MSIRDIARDYIADGWAVVPVVAGKKAAETKWRSRIYTPSDFGLDDNIAGKCGEPSGWRVDVDLDAPEARAAAKILLPDTNLLHGRPGSPNSHYWFHCEGAKTTQFTDIKDAKGESGMLVEIRSTGGYTVLPPSTWTNKHDASLTEPISWCMKGQAKDLAADLLYEYNRDVAIAALLIRHWPGSGGIHAMVGPLAGFLCHAGMVPDQVVRVICTAAEEAGSDVRDVKNYVSSTVAKFAKGEKVTGGPRLIDVLNEALVNKMRGWLKLADMDAIEEMNVKHFWTRLGKDDVIGREGNAREGIVFQRPRALYSEYANRKVIMGEDEKTGKPIVKPLLVAWLESSARRSYPEGVVFAPPPLEAFKDEYNLWSGFAVEPAPGDCSRFLDHLHTIICNGNDEHYQYLLDLCALTVQQPGTPSEVATVLRGKPGTGKGIFIRVFQSIFGRRHFAHLDRIEDLTGFNAMVSGKVIVFADEAFWAGAKKEIGALKRLITEPTVRVTRKGIDSHEETNCIHLFMATNEGWSVPAQLRERRFLALNVSNKRLQDTVYFKAIAAELRDGGAAAFLQLMLDRATDADKVRNVPKTDELRNQQLQTLAPELQWWLECLTEGEIPGILTEKQWMDPVQGVLTQPFTSWTPRELDINRVYQAYVQWTKNAQHRDFLSSHQFGARLGELMWAGPAKRVRVAGELLWMRTIKSLEDARAAFDAECGSTGVWS